MNLQGEYKHLLDIVAENPPTAVAFSGGADSALLLKAAVELFGNQALAFFASSVLQTRDDIDNAVDTAAILGANLQVVEIFPLEWSEFTANPVDRCYLCKNKIYTIFKKLMSDPEMALADGSNLDDLSQERPGHRAIEELGVLRPLLMAGMNKTKIRRLGKYLGVPSWNRESASCLATRIPSGIYITTQRLRNIASYERILHKAGFIGSRARISPDDFKSVQIEVKIDDLPKINVTGVRKKISAELKKLGVENLSFALTGRQ